MGVAQERAKPAPPIDKGWAWMVVLGVFIYVFFMVGIAKSYGLFMLAFRSHFEASTAYAAMPMSITAFVYAFGAPTAILVAEIITPQKVVIIGAITGLVGIALCSLLLSMGFVIVMYGLCVGIGNSCFYGNGLVMIGKYFKKRRSLATGVALAGASIGQFVLPPIIEYMLGNYGLSGTLLIIGAFYSHCAISGALFRPIEQYSFENQAGIPPQKLVSEIVQETEESTNIITDRSILNTNELSTALHECEERQSEVPSESIMVVDCDSETTKWNGKIGEELISRDVRTSVAVEDDPEKYCDINDKKNGLIDRDDESSYFEHKALLASTGSIFLVTQSVMDVSQIDSQAHGLNLSQTTKAPTGLGRIIDFRVLKSYVTLFYTTVSFLCFFGYFNLILFLPAITDEKGISKYEKALLVSICGAGELIARIGTGFFADFNWIPRYKLKAGACILSGFNMLVIIFANTFSWLAFHCFCYGFLGGAYVCLMSVVLVDFVGMELMAKNLAVILLIQGMGAAVGQTFLGWIRDWTGTFDYVVAILGLNMMAGGLLLCFYHIVQRKESARLASVLAKRF